MANLFKSTQRGGPGRRRRLLGEPWATPGAPQTQKSHQNEPEIVKNKIKLHKQNTQHIFLLKIQAVRKKQQTNQTYAWEG